MPGRMKNFIFKNTSRQLVSRSLAHDVHQWSHWRREL